MMLLLVFLLPLFVAQGVFYLLLTLGDAVVTAATDWLASFSDAD